MQRFAAHREPEARRWQHVPEPVARGSWWKRRTPPTQERARRRIADGSVSKEVRALISAAASTMMATCSISRRWLWRWHLRGPPGDRKVCEGDARRNVRNARQRRPELSLRPMEQNA